MTVQTEHTITAESLQRQVRLVAQLRAGSAVAAQQIGDAYKAWQAEHATEIQQAERYATDLALAETRLREMALDAYTVTGDKRPVSGVAIQVRTRLQYDPEQALEWAISGWRRSLLTIKRVDFERLARALATAGTDDALGFVELVQEPACIIATDLSPLAKEPPSSDEFEGLPF